MRVKEILQAKGMTQADLAKKMDISRQLVNSLLKNPTLKSIEDIANGMGCEVQELFETSEDYAHFYDKGEWLGIRKKY